MKLNRLGFIDTALDFVTGAASDLLDKGSGPPGVGPGPGAPGMPGAVPGPGGPVTVSPVMQQAFTPQFSPTMTMQQDSPGATVTAAPTQTASPGQVARPLNRPAFPPIPGTYPGPDYGDWPLPVGSRTPGFPEAFPSAMPTVYRAGGQTETGKLLTAGLLAVGAIGAITVMNRRKGRRK